MFTKLRRWFRAPGPMTKLEAYYAITGTQSKPSPSLKAKPRSRLQLVTTRRLERRLERARKRIA